LWIGRNNKGDTKSACITFLSRGYEDSPCTFLASNSEHLFSQTNISLSDVSTLSLSLAPGAQIQRSRINSYLCLNTWNNTKIAYINHTILFPFIQDFTVTYVVYYILLSFTKLQIIQFIFCITVSNSCFSISQLH